MDGHEKIATKCADDPPSKGGRPRLSGQVRPFNNGWFFVSSPSNVLILAVHEVKEPENTAFALNAVEDVLHLYPNLDCVIYDRACSILKQATKNENLQQIKYWSVDKFHAKGHVHSCRCHPENILRLKRRLKNVNTSLSEQIFGWFRGYAATFNSMFRINHIFMVHVFSRRHNELIRSSASHLNAWSTEKKLSRTSKLVKKPASRAYSCSSPSASKKTKKHVMKKK
eukprot:s591_g5.t1